MTVRIIAERGAKLRSLDSRRGVPKRAFEQDTTSMLLPRGRVRLLAAAFAAIVTLGLGLRCDSVFIRPPSGEETTLLELLASDVPIRSIDAMSVNGDLVYFVLWGDKGFLAEPPVYVFDASGRLVSWSDDAHATRQIAMTRGWHARGETGNSPSRLYRNWCCLGKCSRAAAGHRVACRRAVSGVRCRTVARQSFVLHELLFTPLRNCGCARWLCSRSLALVQDATSCS